MLPPRLTRQSGITLMEVMVGIVLVGILVLGMNGLWEAAARQLDEASLRQRAVFRLNGEMERLSALYIFAAGPSNPVEVQDYATSAIPARVGSYIGTSVSGKRLIYADNTTTPAVTTSPTTFAQTVNTDGQNANTVYSQIYYLDAGSVGTSTDDRNLVWLDRDHAVLAQLSWELSAFPDTGASGNRKCSGGACQLLTLYLDYPFRYSTDTVDPRGDMGPVETITLQTIVGQR
ncbi:prepilin-type N-terminal cleavage/methylation domain-containing protein [Azospirillum sp. Sh1]|uniref:prepilin-type N-terminal cleavage/methylation domain-containing protein n=1 Tax=Azospirillum sp. Sh1 TaxID=2607285 RepID=UPI0011EBDBB8|nr:prepilin-type N-terminal cleavage/methylation domain-containing protein [Azospirillum sp. Sh1]KAA0571164.1 prepilin-type N-terminal cleavage/methylation domain-containing protein [Azospirillum sp. Sh1]